MSPNLIHVGFGNHLAATYVIAIAPPNAAPIRRMVQGHKAKAKAMAIDMTSGRRTKAALFTDGGHLILAAMTPETVAALAASKKTAESAERS